MLCVIWSDTAFYAAVAAPIGEPDTLLDVRRLVQGAERELARGGCRFLFARFHIFGDSFGAAFFTANDADCNLLFFPLVMFCVCCPFALTNVRLGGFQCNFSDFSLSKYNVEDVGFLSAASS